MAADLDARLAAAVAAAREAGKVALDACVHCIRTGDPCSPTVDDGVAALVLANAADESATTGRTVGITT